MNIKVFDNIFHENISATKKTYAKDEFIFSQGDSVEYVFALEQGQIKLERPTLEGRSITMHIAHSGECFAEAALFSDVYHCNAVSMIPSVVLCYSKQDMLATLAADNQKSFEFMALLSSQVRSLRARLELRNILSARERVIQYLLSAVQAGTGELTLRGPIKEVAFELGLAHETLYRTLADLEAEGAIFRSNKKIKILKI